MINFIVIVTGSYATNDPFIVHPTNQTAAYGEYVAFECRVSTCSNFLTFLVNGQDVEHLNLSLIYYRKNEVVCEEGQQVAILSIIVNNKTLEAVKYVSCNLTTNGAVPDISSSRAYIIDIDMPYLLLTTCPQYSAPTECPDIKSMSHISTAHKEQLSITQIIIVIAIINFFIGVIKF